MSITSPQLELARWLREHGFRAKLEFAVGGTWPKVDLAYPDLLLAIEVNGGYHKRWSQEAEDAHREAVLKREGWQVVWVTNDEIEANLSSAGRRILFEIRKRRKRLARLWRTQ